MIKFKYGLFQGKLEHQANKYGYTFGENANFIEDLRDCFNAVEPYIFAEPKDYLKAEKKLDEKAMSLLKPLEGI